MAIVRRVLNTGPEKYQSRPASMSVKELRDFAIKNNISVQPIDVERLANAIGLMVVYEPMENDLSGYLEKRQYGWVAGINSLQHPKRQRFTIAHEIGHYLLHSDVRPRFDDTILMRRAQRRDRLELEADEFAGELILPAEEFHAKVREGMKKLSDLSAYFDVSMMAVQYKAKLLGYRPR